MLKAIRNIFKINQNIAKYSKFVNIFHISHMIKEIQGNAILFLWYLSKKVKSQITTI